MDGRFPKWQLQHVVAAVALTATVAFLVTATWRRRTRAKSVENNQKCGADDTPQQNLNPELYSMAMTRNCSNRDSKPTCKLKHTSSGEEISNTISESCQEFSLGASKNKYSVRQQENPSLSSPRERRKEEEESISACKENLSFVLKNFKISPILTRCLKELENRPIDPTKLTDQSMCHLNSLGLDNQAITSPDGGKLIYKSFKFPDHKQTFRFSLGGEEPSIYRLLMAPSAIKYPAGNKATDDTQGNTQMYPTAEMDNTQGENDSQNFVRTADSCSQQVIDLCRLNERPKLNGNSEMIRDLCLNTKDSASAREYASHGQTSASLSEVQTSDSFSLSPTSFPTMREIKHEIFCTGIEKYASQISNSRILTSVFQNFRGPKAHEYLNEQSRGSLKIAGNILENSDVEIYHKKFRHNHKDTENEASSSHDKTSASKNEEYISEDSLKDANPLTDEFLKSRGSIPFTENTNSSLILSGTSKTDTLLKVTVPCITQSNTDTSSSEPWCNVSNTAVDHASQIEEALHQDHSQAAAVNETHQCLVSEYSGYGSPLHLNNVDLADSLKSIHLIDSEADEGLDVKYRILKTSHQDFSRKCSVLLSKYSDDTVFNTCTSNGTSLQNAFSSSHFCDGPLYISRSVDDLNIRRFQRAKDFRFSSNKENESQCMFSLRDNKRRNCYSCVSLIEISSYQTHQIFHLTSRNNKTPELPFSLHHEKTDVDKDRHLFFQESVTRVKGTPCNIAEESFNKTNGEHHALINRKRKDLTPENSNLFLNATDLRQVSPHCIQQCGSISYDSESYSYHENWDLNNSLTSQASLSSQRTKYLSSSEENLSQTTTEYFSLSNENLSEESKQSFFSCCEDLSQENENCLSLSDENLSQESSEYFSFSEENIAEGWRQRSPAFEEYAAADDDNIFQKFEHNFSEQNEESTIRPEENENFSSQESTENLHDVSYYSELSGSKIYRKKETPWNKTLSTDFNDDVAPPSLMSDENKCETNISRSSVYGDNFHLESSPLLKDSSDRNRTQQDQNCSQFSTSCLFFDCSRRERPTEEKSSEISTNKKAGPQHCPHVECEAKDYCDVRVNIHSEHHDDAESEQNSLNSLSKTSSNRAIHCTSQKISSQSPGQFADCVYNPTDKNVKVQNNEPLKCEPFLQSSEVYFPSHLNVETLEQVSEKYPVVIEVIDDYVDCYDFTCVDLGQKSRRSDSQSISPSSSNENNEKEQHPALLGASTVSEVNEGNEKPTIEHHFEANCLEIRNSVKETLNGRSQESSKSVSSVSSENIQVNSCCCTQKSASEGKGHEIVNESFLALKPLCVHAVKHIFTWGEEGGGGVPERDSTKPRGQRCRMVNGGPPEVNNRREFPSDVISCASPPEEKRAADHASIGGGQGSAADEIWNGGRNLQLQIVTNSPVPLRQQMVIGDDHCRNSSCIAHEPTLAREVAISAPTPIGATQHVRCWSGHPEKLDADDQQQTSCRVHPRSVACRPESLTAECSIQCSDSSEQRHTVRAASQSPFTSCLDYSSVHRAETTPIASTACSQNSRSKRDPIATAQELQNCCVNSREKFNSVVCLEQSKPNNFRNNEELTCCFVTQEIHQPIEPKHEEIFTHQSVNNESLLRKNESELAIQGTIRYQKEAKPNSSDTPSTDAVDEKVVTCDNCSADYSPKFVPQVTKTSTVSLLSHVKFNEDYSLTKEKSRGKFDFCSLRNAKCMHVESTDNSHHFLKQDGNNLQTEHSKNSHVPEESDFVLAKTRLLDSKLLNSSENLNIKVEAVINKVKESLEISILKLKNDFFLSNKEFEFCFENYISCLKKDFQVTNEKLKHNYCFSVENTRDYFYQHVDKINDEIKVLIAELGDCCEVRAAELTNSYRLSLIESFRLSVDKLNVFKNSLDEIKAKFDLFIQEINSSKTASDTFTDNFCTYLVKTEVELGKSSERLQEDIEILSKLSNTKFEFKTKSKDKFDLVEEKLILKKNKGSAEKKNKNTPGKHLGKKKYGALELKSKRNYIFLKSKCRIKKIGVLIANRLKVMEETSKMCNPRLLGLLDRNRERQARLHYLAEIAQDETPTEDEKKEQTGGPNTDHNDGDSCKIYKAVDWDFEIRCETDAKKQISAILPGEFSVSDNFEKSCTPETAATEGVDTEELYNSNLKAISEAIEHMQELINKDQARRESTVLDEEKDHRKLSEAGTSNSEDWDALMRDVLSHVSSLEEWMKSEGGGGGEEDERTLGLGPNLGEMTKASAGWRDASVRRSPEEFAETSAVVTKESRSPCDARSCRGSEMDVCEVEPSPPEILQVPDSPLKPPTKVKNLRFKLDPDVYDFPSENGHDEDAAPHHRSKSSRHVWFAPQQPKYQAFSSLDLGRNTEPVKVVSVRTSVVPAGQKMVVKPIGFATRGQRSSDVKEPDLPRPQSAEPQIKVRQLDIDLRIRLETENGIESEYKDYVNGNRRPSPDRQTKRAYLSTSPSQAKRRSPINEHSRRVESSPERIDWRDVWTSVSIETNESTNGDRDSPSNNPFKDMQMCDLSEDNPTKDHGDRTGLNSPSLISKATHTEQDKKSNDTDQRVSPVQMVNDENMSDSTTSSRPENTPVKMPRKHLYVPKKKKFVPDPEAIERITGYKTAVSVLKPPLPPLPAAPVISSSYRLISGVKSRTDSARKRYFDSKAMLTARNADGSFKFEQFLTEAQKDRSRLVTSTPDLAAIEVAVKQQWSKENRGSNNELDIEMREQSPSEDAESPDTVRRRRSSTPDDVWMSYVQHLRKQLNRRSRSLGYLETDLDACLAEDKAHSSLILDQTESAPRSLTPGPCGSKFEKRDTVSFSELGRAKSEHELRIEKSLQNLSLPEWYRHCNRPKTGFLLNKNQEEKKGWAAVKSLTSSTTSLASSSGNAALTTRPRRPVRSLRTSRENLTWSRGSASPSGAESNYVTKSSGPSLSLALARAFREPYMGWRARTPSSCASPSPQPDLSPPSWGGGADFTERSDTPLTSDLPTMDEETTAESLEEPFGDIDYIVESGMSPLMHSARDETCEDIKNMSLDTIEIHAPVTNGHHVTSVAHDDTCDDIDNLTMDTFELFDPISNGDIKASLLTSEEDVCENVDDTNNDTAENGDTGFQSSLMLEDTCDDIPNLSTDTSDNIPLVISVEKETSPAPTSKSCPGSCEKDKLVMDSSGYLPLDINGKTESHLIRSSETDEGHVVNGKLNGTTNYEKQNSDVRFRKLSKENKNKDDIKQKRYSYNQSIYHSELHDPPHDEIRELSPATDINGSSQSIPSDSSGSSKVIWIESSFVGSRTTTSIVVLPVEDEKVKDRCYSNQENTGSNPSVGRPASR